MAAAPLLDLADVSVRFGTTTALTAVSLRVNAGERVAVIGPSGAGKSTLLGLCNATVVPTSGQVCFRGEPVRDRDSWRRAHGKAIATVPQQLQLAGRLRAVHNVNAGRLAEWSTARALFSLIAPREVAAARATLERVGIADKLFERTDRLSGGERQRLAIARALRQEPILMLADEPTASLDPARALDVMMLLSSLVAGLPWLTVLAMMAASTLLVTLDVIGGLPFLMSVKPSERTEMSAVYSSFRDVSGIVTPGMAWAVLAVAPTAAIFTATAGLMGVAVGVAGRLHARLGVQRPSRGGGG